MVKFSHDYDDYEDDVIAMIVGIDDSFAVQSDIQQFSLHYIADEFYSISLFMVIFFWIGGALLANLILS